MDIRGWMRRTLKERPFWGGVSPLVLFLLWTGVALLFAFSWYLPAGAEGRPIAFRTAATWYFLDSCVWFALCPAIFFLHQRFPIEWSKIRGYLWQLLQATAFSWAHFFIFLGLDLWFDPAFAARFQTIGRATTQLFFFRTISGIVTYALIVAIVCARDYSAGLRIERERRASVEYQLAKAELNALRMQLHPHFLFNALHSISALIEERPREAIRMITRLGVFLRASLENSSEQLIPLDQEVRFLQLYFQIEEVRVGDRVRFQVDIDPMTTGVLVPNLILQPLVENALRHGVWQQADRVFVTVASRARADSVEIVVRNEARDIPAEEMGQIREGVGLSNVRSRLQQLFPTRFKFQYGWVCAGLFEVSLQLPMDVKAEPS
jgi:hypothetical protein